MRRSNKGFTIVELLVVLVILSLATTLLLSALSVMWKSFERLEQKQLNDAANIGLSWFIESLDAAVQYHPSEPVFTGNVNTIKFITAKPLDIDPYVPSEVTWRITIRNDLGMASIYELWYENIDAKRNVMVYDSDRPLVFSFITEAGQQSDSFATEQSEVPFAIILKALGNNANNAELLAISHPTYSGVADVPPEMAIFGKYEF